MVEIVTKWVLTSHVLAYFLREWSSLSLVSILNCNLVVCNRVLQNRTRMVFQSHLVGFNMKPIEDPFPYDFEPLCCGKRCLFRLE